MIPLTDINILEFHKVERIQTDKALIC